MSYRWVDHTAEVELEIEAASEPEVLEDAVRALAELLGFDGCGGEDSGGEDSGGEDSGGEDSGGEERRAVNVEAADRPALLAGWIEELAFLAESEGFVATRVLDLELSPTTARGTVGGVLDEPPPLVKAVTYHRRAVAPRGGGDVARVVLDV